MNAIEGLASYRRLQERIHSNWNQFLTARTEHLRQDGRYGDASEKVTENILADLFTIVLDWQQGDLNHQVEYADLVLSTFGLKRLVIEAKRPRALSHQQAINSAIGQVVRYAARQDLDRVAISDGLMFYAADLEHGQVKDRVFARLDTEEPSAFLWWISVDGIRRICTDRDKATINLLLDSAAAEQTDSTTANTDVLHKKYGVPAKCFAYVGDPNDQRTWKLPYLNRAGDPDTSRLSGAIRCIVSNYRGVRVSGIPEEAIPDVLVQLGKAARRLGKMPGQTTKVAETYQQLHDDLVRIRRLDELN